MRMAQLPPDCGEENERRQASGTKQAAEPRFGCGGSHCATKRRSRSWDPPQPNTELERATGADVTVELDSRAMTQADLTHQRLVRAALELFTTTGYHLTTTPLIAKKAGVAEGTIYRHFASKQHLLNELYRAAGRWAVRLVKEADALKVGPREKLAELGRGLAAGAGREPAVAQLFFLQRHGDLLDDESGKVARDFRLGLESLIAQGKADGSVKAGAAEVWAGVWLGVVTLVIDRVSAKEWPDTHAGVKLALDGAWDAIAATRG